MRHLIVLLLSSSVGCLSLAQREARMGGAPPSRSAAPTVRFVDSLYEVKGCQSAGRVRESSTRVEYTRGDLVERAVERGADTVVITDVEEAALGTVNVHAMVFRCAGRRQAAAKEPSVAKKKRPVKKLKVALIPTVFEEKASDEVPKATFDDVVATAITDAGAFEVIGQSDIEAMLTAEQQRELLGCDSARCFAEIGGALGVPLLVGFRVARVGEEWTVTSRGIDMQNTSVVRRSTDFVEGDAAALLRAVPELVKNLLSRDS